MNENRECGRKINPLSGYCTLAEYFGVAFVAHLKILVTVSMKYYSYLSFLFYLYKKSVHESILFLITSLFNKTKNKNWKLVESDEIHQKTKCL